MWRELIYPIGVGFGVAMGLAGGVMLSDLWRAHYPQSPQTVRYEVAPVWDWPWFYPATDYQT